jgi:hypothetical protein
MINTAYGPEKIKYITSNYYIVTGDPDFDQRSRHCHLYTQLTIVETEQSCQNKSKDLEEWEYITDEKGEFFNSNEEYQVWCQKQSRKQSRKQSNWISKEFKQNPRLALYIIYGLFEDNNVNLRDLWYHLVTSRVCCYDLMMLAGINKMSDLTNYPPISNEVQYHKKYIPLMGQRLRKNILKCVLDYKSRIEERRYI